MFIGSVCVITWWPAAGHSDQNWADMEGERYRSVTRSRGRLTVREPIPERRELNL